MAHKHHRSPLFEIARVLVCFNHVARFIVNESERHSFLSASLNGMVRSTLPVESKIRNLT